MGQRRISFVICYIAFKIRISFNKHMKRFASQPEEGRVCEEIHVVAGWDQCGGTKHTRERGITPVMYVKRLLSL